MYLHNGFTHCVRRGWGLGTEDNVLNFKSAMMCTNNVLFTNLRIMDAVIVISLTHKRLIEIKLGKFYLSLFPLLDFSRLSLILSFQI